MKTIMFVILGICVSINQPVHACTAFKMESGNKMVFGKSYDWYFAHGHGAVITNGRGIVKTALPIDGKDVPALWKSRFGSVTLTQFGKDFPVSGMNEAGLVVEMLQLEEAEYNSSETNLPYVNESQWVQYQLDNYSSTKQVVTHMSELRIEQQFTGIHYFICDATGDCAVVEFIKGKPVSHSLESLPISAITNNTYEDSMIYYKAHENEPFDITAKPDPGSLKRFWTISKHIQHVSQLNINSLNDLETLAFKALDAVKREGLSQSAYTEPTQWNIVYDPINRSIAYRTKSQPKIKYLDTKLVDFNCHNPSKIIDMNLGKDGPINSEMTNFDLKKNADLVNKNWAILGKELRQKASMYPMQFTRCE